MHTLLPKDPISRKGNIFLKDAWRRRSLTRQKQQVSDVDAGSSFTTGTAT
jgi:hypothetical protein